MTHLERETKNGRDAAYWAVYLKRCSPANDPERAAFVAWLNASRSNVESLFEELGMDAALMLLGSAPQSAAARQAQIKEWAAIVRSGNDSNAAALTRARRSRRKWSAVAAIVIIAAAGAFELVKWAAESAWHEYAAVAGQTERTVRLADGSLLNLYGGALVKTRVSSGRREAEVFGDGRVGFDIHHDPALSFVVRTSAAIIVVKGTQFDVALDPSRTKVGVVEGRVRVSPRNNETAAVMLGPGEGTIVMAQGARQRPRPTLFGGTLAQVADAYNRRNRSPKFAVQGTACVRPITAALYVDDPAALILALENDPDIELHWYGDTVVVRERADQTPVAFATESTCTLGDSYPPPVVSTPGASAGLRATSLRTTSSDEHEGETTPNITSTVRAGKRCLLLNGEALKAVVTEVNRYNTRQLMIVDPAIEEIHLGGFICPTDLDSVLRAFRHMNVYVVDGDLDPSGQTIRLAGTPDSRAKVSRSDP